MKGAIFLLCLVALASAKQAPIDSFMRPTGLERFNNLLKAVEYARIVGGVESEPHTRPYQVKLY